MNLLQDIKSIRTLMIVDLKLVLKNIFFWVLVGVLVAIILAVNFLLPKTIESPSPEIITYGMEGTGVEAIYPYADTKEALQEQLNHTSSMVGVIYEDDQYTVLANNYNKKEGMAVLLPLIESKEETIDIQVVQMSDTIVPQPFNKRSLPVFICFEAVVQGFLLAGVLMLNEKSGKMVSALQISPIGAIHYWIAKILLFSIMGSLYAWLMAVFTVGIHFPIVPFIVVSFIASALFTMIGMITAVFFRSINNWFMMASFILGINMLTMFTYVFPSLKIPFIEWIPSYPFIFLYEQIVFGHFEGLSGHVTVMLWLLGLSVSSIYCINNVFLRPKKGV